MNQKFYLCCFETTFAYNPYSGIVKNETGISDILYGPIMNRGDVLELQLTFNNNQNEGILIAKKNDKNEFILSKKVRRARRLNYRLAISMTQEAHAQILTSKKEQFENEFKDEFKDEFNPNLCGKLILLSSNNKQIIGGKEWNTCYGKQIISSMKNGTYIWKLRNLCKDVCNLYILVLIMLMLDLLRKIFQTQLKKECIHINHITKIFMHGLIIKLKEKK